MKISEKIRLLADELWAEGKASSNGVYEELCKQIASDLHNTARVLDPAEENEKGANYGKDNGSGKESRSR